ncbi:tRNA (N6-threonylcarbamoyladenosine(37)-N6)-methyltransferase TrmO [Oceanicola sp. D3]|uniref:tRNA (N6-threonylcarbamoyladenosine(37)-N6)-methyltransferase TrmO n=1 Tax=Oceanicola sp. D3 TaxID=2587163 RepID=UPI0011205888|nr:tRNA (N6-threonylcarbamoyladenosine(37)-N6)-methyltransferase TrmO [Oceanicola sp. D3]QDC08430.1 tRNA (N6-threonylcarbamoyladenosine(37)-N6)-methyltransferase TrmO [Oceanicola sp. D3]
MKPPREGEVRLEYDPAERVDAGLHFIGVIRSDWREGKAPKNLRLSRAQGGGSARVELHEQFVPALEGLKPGDWVMLLYWTGEARRDLLVQTPRHADGPRGTFSLRSPARPNPVALGCVRIEAIEGRTLHIDATDAFDGTPVVDIKPWIETVDSPA